MSEMTKQFSTGTALAFLAAIALVGLATAQAKQHCSDAAGHGGYWSWRQIDGRKCWYEGKPMLSKDLLEWAAPAAAEAEADAAPAVAPAAPAASSSAAPAMRRAPMDARAQAPDDSGSFEAMWRTRIGY
jgi:hypothetical protein